MEGQYAKRDIFGQGSRNRRERAMAVSSRHVGVISLGADSGIDLLVAPQRHYSSYCSHGNYQLRDRLRVERHDLLVEQLL